MQKWLREKTCKKIYAFNKLGGATFFWAGRRNTGDLNAGHGRMTRPGGAGRGRRAMSDVPSQYQAPQTHKLAPLLGQPWAAGKANLSACRAVRKGAEARLEGGKAFS